MCKIYVMKIGRVKMKKKMMIVSGFVVVSFENESLLKKLQDTANSSAEFVA